MRKTTEYTVCDICGGRLGEFDTHYCSGCGGGEYCFGCFIDKLVQDPESDKNSRWAYCPECVEAGNDLLGRARGLYASYRTTMDGFIRICEARRQQREKGEKRRR